MTKEELLQIPFYIENINSSAITVSITKNNANAPTLNLEYTTTPDDDSSWTTKTMNKNTTANTFTCPAKGKLYFRGENDGWCDSSSNSYYNKITTSGNHNVGGNIMSLLYGSNFKDKTEFPTTNSYVLCGLFFNNNGLVNAQDLQLPATTLANYCYSYMFYACYSLTIAPELPATTLATNCYYSMFQYCNKLTTAPELPATTLDNNCYYQMFYGTNVLPDCSNIDFTSETVVKSGGLRGLFAGTKVTDEDLFNILPINPETGLYYLPVMNLGQGCYGNMFKDCKSLITAPELPATTLVESCYWGMFSGCTSLTTAPELPATTLVESCYWGMFSGCTSLTTAPELPATTLASSCYNNMFKSCSKLTTAPALPATTLASSCYNNMFNGCTNLTTAPELPATKLATQCYQQMFQGCTSLVKAPELPATTLANQCNHQMFQGCSKLNYIKAKFTSYNSSYFTDWVSGVSSTGTFVYNPEATFNPEEIRGTSGIPEGWTIKKAYSNTHCYIVNNSSNNSLNITNNSGNNIQYLVDDSSEWVTLSSSNEPQIISFKDGITLKGNNTSLNGLRIKTSKDSSLNGNLTALLYSDNYTTNDNIIPTNSKDTFRYLFVNYRTLKDVSKLILPDNTVDNCYQHMFTGCKSLTSLPVFPDNNIELNDYCYHGMFMDCDELTSIALPLSTLAPYAYSNMFLGCNNLNSVKVTYQDMEDSTVYKNWLKNVKSNGTFKYISDSNKDTNTIKTNYYVPENWSLSRTTN